MKIYETTNKKWYHKDDVEIQLNINDIPPEGFIPGRKSSIGATMSTNRKTGKIQTWNKGIPASEEQKQKQSIAMQDKEPWNKGLTKETDIRIKAASDKLLGHKCFVTDWDTAKQKEYITKKANGTMNSSQPEELMYKELCNMYGEDNVIHSYSTDSRYPFNCDFYIKSEDLFIELNYTWEHGGHPFDENNEKDWETLYNWQLKASEGKNRYSWAIKVWTERDPLKLATFRKNHLNFQIIYKDITITK